MVQLPCATNVAVLPDSVQTAGVVEVKLTAKPEVADALSVRVFPTVCVGIALKVMVCDCWMTEKLCEIVGAAAYVVLPPWEA